MLLEIHSTHSAKRTRVYPWFASENGGRPGTFLEVHSTHSAKRTRVYPWFASENGGRAGMLLEVHSTHSAHTAHATTAAAVCVSGVLLRRVGDHSFRGD